MMDSDLMETLKEFAANDLRYGCYFQQAVEEIERLQAENACLKKELAECKEEIKADNESISQMHRIKATLRAERDALAAQVLQMREALGAIATYPHKPDDVKRWADEALAIDTTPAEQIIAKVKAEAQVEVLKEAADACVEIRLDGTEPPRTFANNYVDGYSDACSECEIKLHRMADELENK